MAKKTIDIDDIFCVEEKGKPSRDVKLQYVGKDQCRLFNFCTDMSQLQSC